MKSDFSKFTAVTTFDLKKHPFAIEMVNSFVANWPDNIKLLVYLENANLLTNNSFSDKIDVREYHNTIPEYNNFYNKFKHKDKFTDNFKFNVFRFAYKVFAIKKALSHNKTKFLIWLDSDTKTHKKIPITFLENLTSNDCYMSYLGRSHIKTKNLNYSECGFLIFNTEHKLHQTFWVEMMSMYEKGKLFELEEWHDSYIFDYVRIKLEKKLNLLNFNISELGLVNIENQFDEHVFVLSVLGEYMDHKKGERKKIKWSPELIKRIKVDRNLK